MPNDVPKELVAQVLTVAGWSPSAHNSQPWKFIVLKDSELKQKLSLAMATSWAADLAKDGTKITPEKLYEMVKRFTSTPVLIFACSAWMGFAISQMSIKHSNEIGYAKLRRCHAKIYF